MEAGGYAWPAPTVGPRSSSHPPSRPRRSVGALRPADRATGRRGLRPASLPGLHPEGQRGDCAAPSSGDEMPTTDLIDVALVEDVEDVQAKRRARVEVVAQRRVGHPVIVDAARVRHVRIARADVADAAPDLDAL